MYRVIVAPGVGSLDKGFESISFTLIDPDGNPQLKRLGALPPNLILGSLYQQWKQLYRGYYSNINRFPYRLEFLPDDENPYFSESEFRECCDCLQTTLNEWLGYPDFVAILNLLRSRLPHSQSFQWIIESADPVIQHLPWHLWNFFQDYPLAEVAISLPEFEHIIPSKHTLRQKLKILVILGKTVNDLGDEINVQADRRLIESTPQVSAVFVNKTSRTELSDLLWEQDWDVILFAGHSSGSGPQGKAGFLLNSDETHNLISIQDLEPAFKNAIKRGLKLVIFNSCDSFELGLDLMRLNLPQCIAMSEAIPDAVAQRFLRYLIQQWYEEQSFVIAVRHARARLKESEEILFPCASWLPVICQNPATLPPTWPIPTLKATSMKEKNKPQNALSSTLFKVVTKGIGISIALLGFRWFGGLEGLELKAFDQFWRLSPTESVDDHILLITISEADIQYQAQQNMPMRGSLADRALTRILEKLKPLNPKAVGVDIFHDFEYASELKTAIQTIPNFIAACEVGFSEDQPGSIASPPSILPDALGFTDIVIDSDERIRRQLLRMTESTSCPTDYGLGLKLAEVYLSQKVQIDDQGRLRIGTLQLPQLTAKAGGYSLPTAEAAGYQIMTRYRHARFNQLSLQEVLTDSNRSQFQEWARNRLIMIGLKQRGRDSLYTPVGVRARGKLTGLEIHAHMASQLINGVQNDRPLFWWWSEWVESVWISLWVMIGVIVTHFVRSPLVSLGILGGSAAIATLICYGVFLMGGWIPWVPMILGLGLVMISGRISAWLKLTMPSLSSQKS